MITKNTEHEHEEIGFLELFYNVLFKPTDAKILIKYLRDEASTKLFLYSVFSVILGAVGLSSYEGNISVIFNSVFTWLFTVLLVGLLAWLLRPKESSFDFGLVFFFCAFAQAPLIFLGLANLWKNSYFPTTIPSAACFLWSIILWIWAISNSLHIGNFKAVVLVVLTFVAPILIVLCLAIMVVATLLSFVG
ncbi:MAG: hypothetical protein SFU25_10855 [Candidatus Caenarcaniphilales bacterium]|nr:hypothetical protein [Candidatus Caenarcaniphilales bacterium]